MTDLPTAPDPTQAATFESGAAAAASLDWQRLHPITPLVRGWAVVLVLIVIAGRNSLESDGIEVPTNSWWMVIVGVLGVGLIGGFIAWLSWRMTRYAYDDEAVYVHSGILFRQQRKVRLDRLQAIDIVKPLLARFFGLSELSLSVAGGGDSGAKLGFLRDADADRLRNILLARAAGVEVPSTAGVVLQEAPETPVIEVPTGRLIASLLLSAGMIVLAIVTVATVTVMIVGRTAAPIGAVLPVFFGLGAFVLSRFTTGFNFTAAISPDGIRLRHGLLETRSQTIPPGRVQAIRLGQGLLWRKVDWWRVEVNVAGYSATSDGTQASAILLPVGTRDEALRALWLVLPDLGIEDPHALLAAAMSGRGDTAGFVTSPRRARWIDPLAWQRNGYRAAGRAIVIRRGWLGRWVYVVPHEKTQSLRLTQGPVQRRLGLTSLALHSTPGPVLPRVVHLSETDGAFLLQEQEGRARTARSLAGPERWMEPRE